jgi:hypothetical protein
MAEQAPLIKRADYSNVTEVGGEDASVVQCCGIESSRLGRVPVIRTIFRKKEPNEKVGGVPAGVILEHAATLNHFHAAGHLFIFNWGAAVYVGSCSRHRKYMEVSKDRG